MSHQPGRPAGDPLWGSLKTIARQHRRRLAATFSLVALENFFFIIYPMFGSFAIDAVLQGKTHAAVLYGLAVLIMWIVGALRRSVDTRVFARIYAELVVPVILEQRQRGVGSSAISARTVLTRDLVDFFEHQLPTFITSTASVVGAVVMLLIIEFWVGALISVVLLFFGLLMPRFTAGNDALYGRLNNRLEKEVYIVGGAQHHALKKHYSLTARLRIMISNREAAGYMAIGVALCVVFTTALALLSQKETSAGHIYAVLTYLWTFAMSLDDAPRLLERYANLKDISRRVQVRTED